MNKFKMILSISIALNIVLCLFALYIAYKNGATSFVSMMVKGVSEDGDTVSTKFSKHYLSRVSLFNTLSISEDDIVFVGDSITERNVWTEMYPDTKIINRGISGDTTEGVKQRIQDVAKDRPRKIFIMIGVNDLIRGVAVDHIMSNYRQILRTLKEVSPSSKVHIQSVLPVNKGISTLTINNDIRKLNKGLKKLAEKENLVFIDLHRHYVDKKNELNANYTIDGLHLSGKGYMNWRKHIKEYVQ